MSTPAGWYPDPSRTDPTGQTLRWWDGTQWTDHTHRAGPPAPQANPYAWTPPTTTYPDSQYPRPGVKAIATPDGQALGGFLARAVARIIDGIVVTIIATIASWKAMESISTYSAQAGDLMRAGDLQGVLRLSENPQVLAASQTVTWIFLLVSAVYTILPVRFYGATFGKFVVGVRVRAWNRPGRPSWGQAVARWAACDLLGRFLLIWYVIDWVWPLADQRRQALHDKLARTVVVKRR